MVPQHRPRYVLYAITIALLFAIATVWFVRGLRPRDDPSPLLFTQTGVTLYHERFGHFPAAIVSEAGKLPCSWRVAILPFINEKELFDRYRFDEPWDSPTNKQLLPLMPSIFSGSSNPKSGYTKAVAIVDETSFFPPGRHTNEFQCKDSDSRTILLVQIPESDIPWTEPRDISFSQFVDAVHATRGRSNSDPVRYVMNWGYKYGKFTGDESVDLLHALITINGHDDPTPFFVWTESSNRLSSGFLKHE
jgi:hypothetical protein